MIEYFECPLKSLVQQRSRTILTLLGMIIGIAVIVAMISITQGMKTSVSDQLDRMGSDKISILPAGAFGGGFGPPQEFVPFGNEELREIERIPGVSAVAPYFTKSGVIEFRNKEFSTVIGGATEETVEIFKDFFDLSEGRFVREDETDVINIGYRVSKDVFDSEVRVGDSIKVNGRKFNVVGIFGEFGNRQDDTSVYMSIRAAQDLFNAKNEINFIYVVADNEEVVGDVSRRIEERLKKMRGGKDFEILTTEEFAEQVNSVLSIIEFVLAGIASVSLIVGGVIIMNTMLMNVLERTHEIGIMKAIGANNLLILNLFLVESGLIGLVGGVIGILFGSAIAKFIEHVGQAYIGSIFITVISKELVIGALLFSFIMGSLSGIYPAWRASRLNPIDALRFE
jgi:putative ABC transport system permease protein